MPPTFPLARFACRELFAATLLLLGIATLPAQDLARRLILKDGSYQLITKYEVKGDRVRYFSAERDDWEELPASLVDWPATEKFEKGRAAGSSIPEAAQLDKELEEENARAEIQLPQVAPGLRLPEDSGVFLLDNFRGEPQILELQQTEGDIDRNTKGNIFHGAINPLAGLKQIIQLDGDHAAVQSHVAVPSLYLNVDAAPDPSAQPAPPQNSGHTAQGSQPPQVQSDRYRIVRTEIKNGKRIVGDVKRQVTGKTTQEQHFVTTTTTPITGGWLKIAPTESLPPGEYALVEIVGKEGMNLYVYDFGVNPNAPANKNPWKPDPKSASAPAVKSDSKQ